MRSAVVALFSLALCAGAQGSIIEVGKSSFPASSTLISFTGYREGTTLNALGGGYGVTFSYLLNGSTQNTVVGITDGSGQTNNVGIPNLDASGSNYGGTLILTFASPVNIFGFGYALESSAFLADATTVALFNNGSSLGSAMFAGSPDPNFTGGFAGVYSTTSFNQVDLTFDTTVSKAFALDNFEFGTVSTPEPASWLLLASALSLLMLVRRPILNLQQRAQTPRLNPANRNLRLFLIVHL
jgi:hypothetical protein